MVIVVCGLPGSGKSFLATRLADALHAAYFSSDVVRASLPGRTMYSDSERIRVYDLMLEAMREPVDSERDVVLDATFFWASLRDKARSAAADNGVNIAFIEVRAAEEAIRERLKQKRPHSDADFHVYEQVRDRYEALTKDFLPLRSDQLASEEILKVALDYIEARR